MYHYLIYSIAIGFALFALFNIVIRFTVFKMYSELRKKGVEFDSKLFFNERKLKEYVEVEYPDEEELIMKFVKYTKFAMTFATVLLVFILALGFVLVRMK